MNLTTRPVLDDNTQRILSDVGLLVLRLAAGAVFVAHGWGDVSQPGGAGANIENYRGAGIPLPEVSAWFGAYMQLIGGVLLLCGALTRVVAAGLAVVMAGALIFVHPGEALVMGQDGSGSGFAFIMLAASLALVCTGAGGLAVDRLFGRRRTDDVRSEQPSGAR
ncbi:DoxX family protein [Myceligenerans pegani]|uniref:DoxX family protein n=1 Tax=Myceligenerans pegani TaxID=2776917 RepID=A0ABR9MY27_9MICO|nr:DoxX family protein [Myceligenerans sp. TRM 65318]MBE1876285.1 DoxX family protein [Myceligenerans sp. TRM 65318]MBE3018556.1 DoxX family protein [Myceligenerans sp. TRM 65318]